MFVGGTGCSMEARASPVCLSPFLLPSRPGSLWELGKPGELSLWGLKIQLPQCMGALCPWLAALGLQCWGPSMGWGETPPSASQGQAWVWVSFSYLRCSVCNKCPIAKVSRPWCVCQRWVGWGVCACACMHAVS